MLFVSLDRRSGEFGERSYRTTRGLPQHIVEASLVRCSDVRLEDCQVAANGRLVHERDQAKIATVAEYCRVSVLGYPIQQVNVVLLPKGEDRPTLIWTSQAHYPGFRDRKADEG